MKATKNSSTKSTKNTKSSNCSNSKGKGSSNCCNSKSSKNSSEESDSDPQGSYTGNPVGWGKYAEPVQDVDDL